MYISTSKHKNYAGVLTAAVELWLDDCKSTDPDTRQAAWQDFEIAATAPEEVTLLQAIAFGTGVEPVEALNVIRRAAENKIKARPPRPVVTPRVYPLQHWREKAGLTRTQLARRAGVSLELIRATETGGHRQSMRRESAEVLAAVLKIKPVQIAEFRNHPAAVLSEPMPSEPGKKLRWLRRRAGLTQPALAKRAGVAVPTIAVLERGGRAFDETITRLAAALKADQGELAGLVSRRETYLEIKFNPAALTALRQQRGFSRAELAARSGLTPAAVRVIEIGQSRPTKKTFEKLVAALEVQHSDLLAS